MLDYQKLAKAYMPPNGIRILLVGEAPPPGGSSYFYKPTNVVRARSLPATIFQHYFDRLPANSADYVMYLRQLQNNGIFLIDICDEPVRVRDQSLPGQINPEGLARILSDVQNLPAKISQYQPESVHILRARNKYQRVLREVATGIPDCKISSWSDFRHSREVIL